MSNFLLHLFLPVIMPLILGYATTYIMQGLKIASSWVANQPAIIQRSVIFALGTGLAAAAHALGVPLPCDPTAPTCNPLTWDSTVYTGLLTAAFAMIFHAGNKVATPTG